MLCAVVVIVFVRIFLSRHGISSVTWNPHLIYNFALSFHYYFLYYSYFVASSSASFEWDSLSIHIYSLRFFSFFPPCITTLWLFYMFFSLLLLLRLFTTHTAKGWTGKISKTLKRCMFFKKVSNVISDSYIDVGSVCSKSNKETSCNPLTTILFKWLKFKWSWFRSGEIRIRNESTFDLKFYSLPAK